MNDSIKAPLTPEDTISLSQHGQVILAPLPDIMASPAWSTSIDCNTRTRDGAAAITWAGEEDRTFFSYDDHLDKFDEAHIQIIRDVYVTPSGELEVHEPLVVMYVEDNPAFTPAQARALAVQLNELADIIDGGIR